jgi:beta-lactamase regulating signal transducer with metallopeptidase domain
MTWNIVGLCLLHFLWQGALIGTFTGALVTILQRSPAQARYVACFLAMLAMGCCPLFTAWILSHNAISPDTPLLSGGFLDFRIVVLVWLIGVALLTARLLGGFGGYLMLSRTGLAPAPRELQERFQALADSLGIRIPPRLYLSSRVAVPTAIGLVKGIVLLPASFACGVSPKMLDALLLHELAHVSRFDFLANAIQCVVEVLLFYHPAVWWLSKRIRQERENCCDDIVIRAFEDRQTYVKALATAAEMKLQPLTMRSDGGDLVARVRRILGKPPTRTSASPLLLALILIGVLLTPVVASFKTPLEPPKMIGEEHILKEGEVKTYLIPLPENVEITINPAVIDAVEPVKAVDRETALKNGWITPDQ